MKKLTEASTSLLVNATKMHIMATILIFTGIWYIQRPEYGGGEIYFDDVLIRKDGRFVVTELEALNPENLK